MNLPADLNALSPEQLRTLAEQLIAQVQERERELQDKTREVDEKERELHYRQTRIDQLTHEISILKRQQFGRRSEQLGSEQMNLLDEAIDADLVAIELELEQLKPDTPTPRRASSLNAQGCQHSCRAQRSITSPIARCASVAASVYGLARTSARSWITRQASSRLSGISVGSGCARTAKR
jgi:hypothetical protein